MIPFFPDLHRLLFVGMLVFLPGLNSLAQADEKPSVFWHLGGNDLPEGPVGANVTNAWRMFDVMVPREFVTVAVLDDGVNVSHPDLQGAIWTNPGEVPFNDVDDDGNGLIDDAVGWNFLVDSAGNTIYNARFEVIWALAIADSLDSLGLTRPLWLDDRAVNRAREIEQELQVIHSDNFSLGITGYLWQDLFEEKVGRELKALEQLIYWKKQLKLDRDDFKLLKFFLDVGLSLDDLSEYAEEWIDWTNVQLNPEWNPRDPNEPEWGYGNLYCAAADSDHGTHVAGIIAAQRNNSQGMDGVASGACNIMTLRVVPDGDEKDKDVANGIRYAVDRGAKVINMSFGKAISPQVELVRDALRYAADHDVLLVHAAGNDSYNTDNYRSYPNPNGDPKVEACFISVGATTSSSGRDLVADFSNYGKQTVDLFAPGDEIYSLAHEQDTTWMGGTSMAAPVVSGVAALLRAHFPHLTAADVKTILMESVYQPAGEYRIPGGGKKDLVPFSDLCVSGGMVDALEAVKLALTYPKP
jgi:subtilisin family serine protease